MLVVSNRTKGLAESLGGEGILPSRVDKLLSVQTLLVAQHLYVMQ